MSHPLDTDSHTAWSNMHHSREKLSIAKCHEEKTRMLGMPQQQQQQQHINAVKMLCTVATVCVYTAGQVCVQLSVSRTVVKQWRHHNCDIVALKRRWTLFKAIGQNSPSADVAMDGRRAKLVGQQLLQNTCAWLQTTQTTNNAIRMCIGSVVRFISLSKNF